MSRQRVFYQALACSVSPSPATGYSMESGNSGASLIQSLSRVQSINDSWTINRQNVNQMGQLGVVDRIITEPPNVPVEITWDVADVSNEMIVGLYVSGNKGAIADILNGTQAEKNYFISIAPEGEDAIGYTGQTQVKYVTNGFLTSYSTQGAVGSIPTTTVGVQGFNWATSTGSKNQPLYAIDFVNNTLTTGVLFTIPTISSGVPNSVGAIRPSEISVSISNTVGLDLQDLHPQNYTVSFNLNPQRLTQLNSFFPYAIVPQFPVDVNASITANWGDLKVDSLSNLLCNDSDFTVQITLRKPSCMGDEPGDVAAQWTLFGAKIDTESFNQAIQDVASQATLNFTTTLGGPNDIAHNLLISGVSVAQ